MATKQDYLNGTWGYTSDQPTGIEQYRGLTTREIPSWENIAPVLEQNLALLRARGYTGPLMDEQQSYDSSPMVSEAFKQWATENGIVAGKSQPQKWDGKNSAYQYSLFDQNSGDRFGEQTYVGNDYKGDLLGVLSVLAAPIAGAAFGPGASAGAAGGSSAAGKILNPALIESMLGTAGYGVSSASLAGAGLGAGGGLLAESGGSLGGGAGFGDFIPSIAGEQTLNPALIESLLQTPGYGASSAGLGGAAAGIGGGGLLAAEAGSSPFTTVLPDAVGASGTATSTLPSVLVSGSAAPAGGLLGPALAGGAGLAGLGAIMGGGGAPAMENLPQADYSNEGKNYSGASGLDPVGNSPAYTAPGTPFVNVNGGGSILPDWLTGAGSAIGGAVKPIADAVGGAGNIAGIIGGIAGGLTGGQDQTATTQSRTDPRFDQYLYGSGYGDINSLLGAAQNQFKANPSGINPTMQQGLDMSKAALTDPAYAQAYQQMRNVGGGLLGGQVAGNPFTGGGPAQGPTSQAGGPGGLLGNQDRFKALMDRGRGLFSI